MKRFPHLRDTKNGRFRFIRLPCRPAAERKPSAARTRAFRTTYRSSTQIPRQVPCSCKTKSAYFTIRGSQAPRWKRSQRREEKAISASAERFAFFTYRLTNTICRENGSHAACTPKRRRFSMYRTISARAIILKESRSAQT